MPLLTSSSWDDLYTREITNHTLDPTDEGTIWFDDSSAEDKVISFLENEILNPSFLSAEITKDNASFLDLGTGNGHLLFRLREGEEIDSDDEEEDENSDKTKGWGGRMVGVDYSAKSIDFAQKIAADRGFGPSDGAKHIEFLHHDLMSSSPSPILTPPTSSGYDIVLDKGTFDAISLSQETDPMSGRRICELYKEKVVPLIREGGILLITSCNWTEEELGNWFEGGAGQLERWKAIEYRSFSFGGKKGQSVSSVCFRRVR